MGIKPEEFVHAALDLVGRSYEEMDCQEFVERALEAAGLKIDKAGSNTWYRSMTWTGTPEECISRFGEIPPGAFLFIQQNDGKEPKQYLNDGIGNISHMGIKTFGSPGAVHSSASKGKVCESTFNDKTIKNGGWNRVGLWSVFDYGERINQLLSGEAIPMSSQVATVVAENGKTVNLRSGTSTTTALVDRVAIGTKVIVQDDYGTWCKVMANGKTGYMMSNYLNYDGQPDDTSVDPEWKEKVTQAIELLQEAVKGV